MKRILLIAALSVAAAFPQSFPGTIYTPLVAKDNVQTSLALAMGAADTTAFVTSTTGWQAQMVAYICDSSASTTSCTGTFEAMLVTAVAGSNALTVTRGYGGTTAGAHSAGKLLSNGPVSSYISSLNAELLAVETALGANLANVLSSQMIVSASAYAFTPQTPGGSLSAGSATISLNPCPSGVNSYAVNKSFLYISGGTGTAEPVLVTGGTCTSGSTTGTVIVTVANSHGGAWTIGPATFGWQEAVNSVCASGGGIVTLGGGTFVPHATVTIPCSGIRVWGQGASTTIVRRTEDYGNTVTIGTAGGSINDVDIERIQFLHYNGFTYFASPSTCINQTPAHPAAAHIESNNCVKCRLQNNWLYNMPYGIKINGGALSVYEQNSYLGTWDYLNSQCQYSIAGLQINSVATASAQLLDFFANTFGGYASATRSVTFGTSTQSIGEAVGPKYGIQINSCESCRFIGGEFGSTDSYNVLISPQPSPYPTLEVSFNAVHFDGARLADFAIDTTNESTGAMSSITVDGNFFNGELTTLNAIKIVNGISSPQPIGLKFQGNMINAYASTCVDIEDGSGITFVNNTVKGCNVYNGFSSAAAASGVYIGGRADRVTVLNNQIGGGYFFETYGASNHMVYGLSIAQLGTYSVCNNAPGVAGATGTATDTIYQCFQQISGVNRPWSTAPAATFAGLETCSATNAGAYASVTDSSVNTWGTTITGGGSNKVLAFCNGSNWTVAGK